MSISKTLRLFVLGAVVVLGAAALNAGDADAARGGKGGGRTASINLDQTDPHLGDWVTFTTSGGSRIQVACYRLGLEVIYAADQPTGTAFLLGGAASTWLSEGGSADCYAWLVVKDMTKILAVTTFTAGGAR